MVDDLIDGVNHYKVGCWTKIRKFRSSLSAETPGSVKDKWRNLIKSKLVQEDSKGVWKLI